jgi:ribonucleoside-diphosphate reductase beta chain
VDPMVRSDAVIAGYQHFLRLADRIQWDDEAIDLTTDARNWPTAADARITELVSGFIVGEAGVAEHLHAFFDGDAAATFAAQRRDEERHARFFARYARTVGLDDPYAHVSPEFVDIFERRLPEAAASAGVEAVGLYHMVLEGVVFTAGQYALLERLDDRLPGLKTGMELVLRDEKWHIGFGTRCLNDADLSQAQIDAILDEGERAAALWAPEQAERVLRTLRRRMAAVS